MADTVPKIYSLNTGDSEEQQTPLVADQASDDEIFGGTEEAGAEDDTDMLESAGMI
jgi:MFS family permease